MSDEKKSDAGIFDLTVPVVMTFPALYEPRKFKRNGKERGDPKYSASFVFEPEDEEFKAVKRHIVAVAKAKHPDIDLATLKFPLQNGDKIVADRKAKGKDDAQYAAGKVIVRASSKFEPALAVLVNGKIVDLADDTLKARYKSHFYNGVKVLARLNFLWYDAVDDGKPGVTCYLNNVLSINQGTRLSGGGAASEIFKGYKGSVSAEDPTLGGEDSDDDLPF